MLDFIVDSLLELIPLDISVFYLSNFMLYLTNTEENSFDLRVCSVIRSFHISIWIVVSNESSDEW